MKIKPVITDRIHTKHTSFEIDLLLETNITFISGDSGTGKSAPFSFIEELAAEDKRIKCFNYLDNKKAYKNSIKQSKGKLESRCVFGPSGGELGVIPSCGEQ